MLHRFAVPLAAALLSVGFAAVATPASAAPKSVASADKHCRNKSGKYIACANKAHVKQCRDGKGHYTKCSG